MAHFIRLIAIAIFSLSWSFSSVAQDLIPVEHFGQLPMVDQPSISPSGKHIAVLLNNGHNYNVAVTPFAKQDLVNVVTIQEGEGRIEWIEWVNDTRLLISASYVERSAGKNFKVGRLYAVDYDGSNLIEIKRRKTVNDRYSRYRSNDNVITFLPDDPEHIILQGYDEREAYPVAWKVNVNDNNFEKLFSNDYEVSTWVANNNGNIVLGIAGDKEDPLIRRVWFRQDESSPWAMLREFKLAESAIFNVVGFNTQNKTAYVLSDHKVGRMSLYEFDINTGEFTNLVYAHDRYDLDGVIKKDDKIIGVTYYDDYYVKHYFSESTEQIDELVKNSFKQYQTTIATISDDETKLLVYAVRDDLPGTFFRVDLSAGAANPWFSQYPYLVGKPLPKKQSFTIKASDGVEIPGYLTMPLDTSKPVPLVVLPHGGPNSRDYKYFDPFVQLFANRGYAVLQPNFRGSQGFGSAFEASGYREWGLKMQDDVMAAVDWAIKQPGINGEQMCVVGMSYGGYVALTAAYKTPKRFDCYVSVAGISDLVEFVKTDRAFSELSALRDIMIGDFRDESDVKRMRENSLSNYVEAVQAPILLIHGDRDTRVASDQSRSIFEALKRADKEVDYIELEFGSHFLDNQPNRIRAMKAIESFLAEHLE